MDRRQLQCFIAVVDHGGFSHAADELGIAQPTLSQAIATLEKTAGVRLFHRLGRGVRLTSAGEALLEPARQVLRDFAVAEDSVARVGGLANGHLDIAAIPTLVQPLAELIGIFRGLHPGIVVRTPELEAAGSGSVEAAVTAGSCELGLTELPAVGGGLLSIELGRQPFQLVLPPGTAAPARFPLARLNRLNFVATPPGTSSRAHLDEAIAHSDLPKPPVGVETGHRDALIALVLAGAGAAFLPEPMAAHAQRLGATVVPTTPVVSRRYGLIHRAAPLSPAARAFVACAQGFDAEPSTPSRHRPPRKRRPAGLAAGSRARRSEFAAEPRK